jgi:hypothetical protein
MESRNPIFIFGLCSVSSLIFLFTLSSTYNQEGFLLKAAYSQPNATLDNSGVPILDYGYVAETYIGPQRNPANIAKVALEIYEKYNQTRNDRDLQMFLNNSNWLMENAVSKGNYSLLQYKFPWPPYGMQPPWQSGLAQGRALDVLAKAHQITGNRTYLDSAESLLNAFFVEVKDGGVTLKSPNDGWWYEGYSRPGAIKPGVLSGMTNALLGIYNYYQYTQDPAAKFLFDQGVLALKKNLPKFEYIGGQYSTYDALDNTKPAPFNYHLNQTKNLGKLYDITGEEIFKNYHDRWTNFKLPPSLALKMNGTGENDSDL